MEKSTEAELIASHAVLSREEMYRRFDDGEGTGHHLLICIRLQLGSMRRQSLILEPDRRQARCVPPQR
jgi:hypothetical protein